MCVVSRVRSLTCALLLASLLGTSRPAASAVPKLSPTPAQKAQALSHFGQLPLSFERNAGQTDKQVKFVAKGPGYALFLTPTQAVMTLKKSADKAAVLRMTLKGANPTAVVTGENKLPGEAAYFHGKDKSKWRAHIATYGQVAYKNVYKGVDLRYYGTGRQLEYDFIVQPGASPQSIALGFEGTKGVTLTKAGDLNLVTSGGGVTWHKPVCYQTVGGKRQPVAGRFVVANNTARFAVGSYDHSKPLVIDPALGYSTFLGGTDYDIAEAVTTDSGGNAYITGYTASTDFPRTLNDASTNADVFITKLNKAGTGIIYSVVLGGGGSDYGYGIAVDAHGFVEVCGSTNDSTFPAGSGTYKGGTDGFLAQLKADGSGFYFITYAHAVAADDTGNDEARAVAVDSSDNIYVGGYSNYSTSYSHIANVQKYNGAGLLQTYTYVYDPSNGGEYGYGLTVGPDDSVYLTGSTGASGLNSANNTYSGGGDAFVAKFNTGLGIVYVHYLGGSDYDNATAVAADADGNAYVTGYTYSADFPITEGAAFGGTSDIFAVKLNSAGTAITYATYINGTAYYEQGNGIAVDGSGQAYIAGYTETGTGNLNGFLSQLSSTGSLKATQTLGGSGDDLAYAVHLGPNNVAYVVGFTYSSDFPVSSSAYDKTFNGSTDAFVSAVTFSPPLLTSISPDTVFAGGGTFTLTANGKAFMSGAKIVFNGTSLTTTYVSSTKVTASVSSSLITTAGTASIKVANPAPGGTTGTKTLTIAPKLTALSLSPTSVTGGATSTGTVTLSGNAPSAGVVVTLSSNNTGKATVPSTVTVTSGHSSATFTVTSKPQASNTTVTITAGGAGATKTATLTVNAPKLSALSLSSSVVGGGTPVTATVTLTGKAPSGGTVVTPSTSNSAVATVPSSVTVAAGATTATFTVTTHSVSSNTNVTIGAAAGGTTKTQILTVTAGSGTTALKSLSFSPTTVTGGSVNTTGTVTLTAAVANNTTVALSSSNAAITFPASTVTVPAGATTQTFRAYSHHVSSTTSVTVTASLSGVNKTATITVTP